MSISISADLQAIYDRFVDDTARSFAYRLETFSVHVGIPADITVHRHVPPPSEFDSAYEGPLSTDSSVTTITATQNREFSVLSIPNAEVDSLPPSISIAKIADRLRVLWPNLSPSPHVRIIGSIAAAFTQADSISLRYSAPLSSSRDEGSAALGRVSIVQTKSQSEVVTISSQSATAFLSDAVAYFNFIIAHSKSFPR